MSDVNTMPDGKESHVELKDMLYENKIGLHTGWRNPEREEDEVETDDRVYFASTIIQAMEILSSISGVPRLSMVDAGVEDGIDKARAQGEDLFARDGVTHVRVTVEYVHDGKKEAKMLVDRAVQARKNKQKREKPNE